MTEPVKRDASLIDTELGAVSEENAAPLRQTNSTPGNKAAEEKPIASEEIIIEEISIDGMCGVY